MKDASLLCDFSTDAAFLRCAEKERTRCWAVRIPSDGLQLRSAHRRAALLQFRRRRVAHCAKAAETPFATWAALRPDLAHLPAQRRPSCRPVSPILKHVFGGFAPPLAALAPARRCQPKATLYASITAFFATCTRKGGANLKQPPTSLRPKPLPNLRPHGWCQPQSNAWHPPA